MSTPRRIFFELSEDHAPADRFERALARLAFVGYSLWVYSRAFDDSAEGSVMFSHAAFAEELARIHGEALGEIMNVKDLIKWKERNPKAAA
jgi:hypothetical protein